MKALITGGNGFIGSHLAEELVRQGTQVRRTARYRPGAESSPGDWVRGDVRDAGAMQTACAGCDVVFHLAAKVHAIADFQQGDSEYRSINVEGTRTVLEAASRSGAECFVFFSSVKAMGEGEVQVLDETFPERPESEYGRSKLEAERLVHRLGNEWGMRTVCLRLPLVYGVGCGGNLIRMISAIDRGIFPPPPKLGHARSMVHVANVVEAAILAARSSKASGQTYLVTDTAAHTTRELYELIRDALGRPIPRWHVPVTVLRASGWIGDLVGRVQRKRFPIDSDAIRKMLGPAAYSSMKAQRELGYSAHATLVDALPGMIQRYQSAPR